MSSGWSHCEGTGHLRHDRALRKWLAILKPHNMSRGRWLTRFVCNKGRLVFAGFSVGCKDSPSYPTDQGQGR